MANRHGRKPEQPRPFNPRGALSDGNPQVVRAGGDTDREISSIALSLANQLGRFADEAAAQEGERAGRIAGNDPGFRPSGSVTIRGRSFEDAATQTYLDNLDATLRQDMQSVYEANRENPAALKQAFNVLDAEYRRSHVFPEVQGRFNAQFSRLRLPFENKALSDQTQRAKDVSRASLVDNITERTTTATRLAIGNPGDPATASALAGEIAEIERAYDRAVADETITATQAASLKIKARGELTIHAVTAEAEALQSVEEVEALRDRVRKGFAAGKLSTLDGDHFEALDNKLVSIARAKNTQGTAADAHLKKRVDNFIERATDGAAVPANEWFTLSAEARTPTGQAIVALGEKKLLIAERLKALPIDAAHDAVARMRRELNAKGGPNPNEWALVQFAEKYVGKQVTALGNDMLGLAERKRIVPQVAPIDFDGFLTAPDPRAAAAPAAEQIAARASQARAVGQTFQRRPQYFRPAEKERIKQIVDEGGDRALALAQAIVSGGGEDAPNMLAEIGGDAPLLAQAGNILANGGSGSAARDALDAARMRRDPAIKLPVASGAAFDASARATLGGAYLRQGADGGLVQATAQAIAQVRLHRNNVDPKSAEAKAIYERALQEAAGGAFVDGVQYGGVADYRPPKWWSGSVKVVAPAGARADRLADVFGALRDGDLTALPVPPRPGTRASDLRAARPVWVKGGYRFALGDPSSGDPRWIAGADGAPFVLPFGQMEGELRRRVPGAFIGAQ